MSEVEIEKRFLAKFLPKDLDISSGKEIRDKYIPITSDDKKNEIKKERRTI